jgi:hypothetical protein
VQLQLLATLLERLQIKESEVLMVEFCCELMRTTLKGLINPGKVIVEGIIAFVQLLEV